MKTEQIMERDLHGVVVRQSTKNAYFNANDLLDLFNRTKNENKRLETFLSTKGTKQYINSIIQDYQNNSKTGELGFQPLYSKRGKHGGTWMHPYLFIDFAMWLSPEFKLTCVKWIYDKLISVRIESGDTFKEVNHALFMQKPNRAPHDYANEARMINKLVFGDPSGGQRNKATEKQLVLLSQLQKLDIHYIEEGKDYYDRFNALQEATKLLQLANK